MDKQVNINEKTKIYKLTRSRGGEAVVVATCENDARAAMNERDLLRDWLNHPVTINVVAHSVSSGIESLPDFPVLCWR